MYSEDQLRLIIDAIPAMAWSARSDASAEFFNQDWLAYTGIGLEEALKWGWKAAIFPDDLPRILEMFQDAVTAGQPFEVECRIRRHDGEYRWFLVRGSPFRDASGTVVKWYGTNTDIEERKRAEEEVRQREGELRQQLDFSPQHITVFGAEGTPLYNNRAALDYHGLTLEGWRNADIHHLLHPEDAERMLREHRAKFLEGSAYEFEVRLTRKDGQYRWFLFRYNPMFDEQGRITRWYAAATDIEDRKVNEQRLQNENVALREQLDQAFMFEEIVGSSPALQAVLENVLKVAPTDSTVLISGETGTGKELIARGIHKHSKRSGHAFISVNCASIPSPLIAAELFGHEKGAFTGALQQRQGRFELAHCGTIFLDEIGELPAETQIALLRVLQERQFERVGGNRAIAVDVRVITATNRDLSATIVTGTFRADLFYRLNVFPIHLPPLRERKEDIPILVEYFVKRFSEKMGKQIKKIDEKTFEMCTKYHWPGNIRELQNIVERSVILAAGDTFRINEAWLSFKEAHPPRSSRPLVATLRNEEKEIIEAALREANGRVSGRLGAAVKLGIPPSTLDRKIQLLNINKYRFMSESD